MIPKNTDLVIVLVWVLRGWFFIPRKICPLTRKHIPVCQGMMNWSQWMSCRWDTSDFEGWEWMWKELFFIFALCLKRKTNMELTLTDGLRRYVLSEENMFRFHASFWECTLPKSYTAFEQSLDWRTFFMSSSFLPSTKLFFLNQLEKARFPPSISPSPRWGPQIWWSSKRIRSERCWEYAGNGWEWIGKHLQEL